MYTYICIHIHLCVYVHTHIYRHRTHALQSCFNSTCFKHTHIHPDIMYAYIQHAYCMQAYIRDGRTNQMTNNTYMDWVMGLLRLLGSLQLYVSFAQYSLFYMALLQKRPVISRSLLIVATPCREVCTVKYAQMCTYLYMYIFVHVHTHACIHTCMLANVHTHACITHSDLYIYIHMPV